MPITQELLSILCCPISQSTLRHLTSSEISLINTKIDSHELKSFDQCIIKQKLSDGLITVDSKYVYRISDGIPNMLPQDAIQLSSSLFVANA